MLERHRLKPASKGEPTLLVITLPASVSSLGDSVDTYALPIELREGGFLLAVPSDIVSTQTINEGQSGSEEVMFGPNSTFSVELIEETEDLLETVSLGVCAQVLVIDVHDDVLAFCREYDPVTDSSEVIWGFSTDHPASLPDVTKLMPMVRQWLLERTDDKAGFYTAQEDQIPPASKPGQASTPPLAKKATQAKRVSNAMIADQLAILASQMQELSSRQDRLEKTAPPSAAPAGGPYVGPTPKLPPVSDGLQNPSGVSQTIAAKALSLLSPPPRTRNMPPKPSAAAVENEEPYDALQPIEEKADIAVALAQQSTAITALVAHLAAQSGNMVGELSSLGQSSSSTRGVQRRERMQNELASGSSTFFVQLMQQLHRRLHPSRPVPQAEEDLQGLSVLAYLERQGGFRNQRELGMIAWVLGHAIDAAANGDFKMTKEVLALLLVSVEQAVVDRGGLDVGLHVDLDGRASTRHVPRAQPECEPAYKGAWAPCAPSVDCSVFGLPQRPRGSHDQEGRRQHGRHQRRAKIPQLKLRANRIKKHRQKGSPASQSDQRQRQPRMHDWHSRAC